MTIISDLVPSFCLQALSFCSVFIAVFLTDSSGYLNIEDEKRLFMAIAYGLTCGAWYIAIQAANKWHRLWTRREG